MNTNTNAVESTPPTAMGAAFERAVEDQDMLAQRREREEAQGRLDAQRELERREQIADFRVQQAEIAIQRSRRLHVAQMSVLALQVGVTAYYLFRLFKK